MLPSFVDVGCVGSLRTDDDLDNLDYFGAVGVVLFAHQAPVEDEAAAIAAVELGFAEVARWERAGVAARAVAGISAVNRPPGAHPTLFRRLAAGARDGALAGIGPVDASDLESTRAQMAIAAEHGVPVVVASDGRRDTDAVHAFAALGQEVGLRSEALVFQSASYADLRAITELGATPIIDVSPAGLGLEGVELLLRYGGRTAASAMLGASGDAPFDVMAIPRAAEKLVASDLDPTAVRRILRDNAARVFGFAPRGAARAQD